MNFMFYCWSLKILLGYWPFIEPNHTRCRSTLNNLTILCDNSANLTIVYHIVILSILIIMDFGISNQWQIKFRLISIIIITIDDLFKCWLLKSICCSNPILMKRKWNRGKILQSCCWNQIRIGKTVIYTRKPSGTLSIIA